MQHAKRMVLIDERQLEEYKKLPDDRLKSQLYDNSTVINDKLPDDISAKLFVNNLIRLLSVNRQLTETQPLPPWPEVLEPKKDVKAPIPKRPLFKRLHEDSEEDKKIEAKKIRKSKRKHIKWEKI